MSLDSLLLAIKKNDIPTILKLCSPRNDLVIGSDVYGPGAPLRLACQEKKLNIVTFLLTFGNVLAYAHLPDFTGRNCMCYAVINGWTHIVQTLADKKKTEPFDASEITLLKNLSVFNAQIKITCHPQEESPSNSQGPSLQRNQ